MAWKYDPKQTKSTIEGISDMVYGKGNLNEPEAVRLGVMLDDLIRDIEHLHARAQQRDQLMLGLLDLPYEDKGRYMVYCDDIHELFDKFTDEKGAIEPTPDLDL